MKNNPKEEVNIISLVEGYVKTLNEQCKKHDLDKVYDVRIRNGVWTPNAEEMKAGEKQKKTKEIVFTVATVETKERLTLFSTHFLINNPADLLKVPYKKQLYRELLYNCFGSFAFTIENALIADRLKGSIRTDKTVPENITETPLTPQEAYSPTKS